MTRLIIARVRAFAGRTLDPKGSRVRRARRVLISTLTLAATVTLLLVAMAGPSALGQSTTDSPADGTSPDPTLTPAESRAAYRDQSDAEALATVRDQFDGLLDTPAFPAGGRRVAGSNPVAPMIVKRAKRCE